MTFNLSRFQVRWFDTILSDQLRKGPIMDTEKVNDVMSALVTDKNSCISRLSAKTSDLAKSSLKVASDIFVEVNRLMPFK